MIFGIMGTSDSSDLNYMENLYQEYYPLMASAAGKYVYGAQDREDAIQNAVICLTQKAALLRRLDRPVLASYIYHTVKHAAIDLRRGREKTAQWEGPLEEMEWSSGVELRPAENSLLSQSQLLALREALDRLSPEERLLIEGKYFLEYDDKALARRLGCKPDSIRMMLTRARRRLLELLPEEMKCL